MTLGRMRFDHCLVTQGRGANHPEGLHFLAHDVVEKRVGSNIVLDSWRRAIKTEAHGDAQRSMVASRVSDLPLTPTMMSSVSSAVAWALMFARSMRLYEVGAARSRDSRLYVYSA